MRRLFLCDSLLDQLLHSSAVLEHASAIGRGTEVLEHIMTCLDDQIIIKVSVQISPIPFAGSFVEVNHVHKYPPAAPFRFHSRLHSPQASAGAASVLDSIGTLPCLLESQASRLFPCKRTPRHPRVK